MQQVKPKLNLESQSKNSKSEDQTLLSVPNFSGEKVPHNLKTKSEPAENILLKE